MERRNKKGIAETVVGEAGLHIPRDRSQIRFSLTSLSAASVPAVSGD